MSQAISVADTKVCILWFNSDTVRESTGHHFVWNEVHKTLI